MDLDVRDLKLSSLGKFLDGLSAADVLIPASLIDNKVSLSLKRVTLKDAVREAGLRLG
ncbi:hypothetical protein [Kitasatospora sp. NPDC056531]|uniref:hypothetical protein n=1 Tax=Kitasatospora sp. NPDC056531 TaxID=3345856 RepID=UPI00369B629E